MNRRELIRHFFNISMLGSITSLTPISNSYANNISKVVILGAGWGGLSAAKTIKKLNPSISVTVIEQNKDFQSCPVSNWVIGDLKSMDDITFSYDSLKNNYSIEFLHEKAEKINFNKKNISTEDNIIEYDKLILSPGIELDYSNIENWTNDSNIVFPAAWKAGKETELLAKQVKNINDGGVVCISIPLSPYRCPPGPYERASLIASYLSKYKKRSKLIILDSNEKIVSKGKLFMDFWKTNYSNIIEYRANSGVVGVDNDRVLITDFDDIKCDVANIIPKQRVSKFLKDNNLVEDGKNWASVNAFDFSSTIQKDVFIIGDSTSQSSVGRVPKSGYIANSMGKVCGLAVVSELMDMEKLTPSMINTCYSLVSDKEGISVSAVYTYDANSKKIIPTSSGLSPKSSKIIKENAWDWAQNIWEDMLL